MSLVGMAAQQMDEIERLKQRIAALTAENERLRAAAGDMYRLAAMLCDDDWYYGEQRNGGERLVATFTSLGFVGNDKETRWLRDVVGDTFDDLLAAALAADATGEEK